MSSSLVSSLLIEAPVNRHFAQLHRDPQALTDAVTLYLETGLRRGNPVVVIASPAHTELFLTRLRADGLDAPAVLKSGQLELHDAELMLRKFMCNDMPDWEDFRRAMAAVFERVRAFGRGTTRAYGEMVNLLWQEGKQDAAIRLEEYWNELARLYPFSMFCSYMLDVHHDHTYNGPIEEIGRTHSDMNVHDTRDGEDLHRTLREEVIPLYYQRDRDGLPRGWIKRMKPTIRTLGWRFNANRMVMHYTLKCYIPAAGGTSSDMHRTL